MIEPEFPFCFPDDETIYSLIGRLAIHLHSFQGQCGLRAVGVLGSAQVVADGQPVTHQERENTGVSRGSCERLLMLLS